MREPRRDHYIEPATGEDSGAVLDAAVESLGKLRGLEWVGNAGVTLHLLASLVAEARCRVPRRRRRQGPGLLLGPGRRPSRRHPGERVAALRRTHGKGQDPPRGGLKKHSVAGGVLDNAFASTT